MAYSKVILNGTTLMDVTQDTVDAANLLSGETATKNSGAKVTGAYTPPAFSTQSKTVSPSTTSQTVQPDSGYDGLSSVTVNAMPSGSASTPATSITANPSISVSSDGLITATASASQNVTPTVSEGYVTEGTAGTITVSGSNTSQLTTQAAQTITPTTTNQTIASGKYLTGTQTILGDANLVASNIADGVTIFGITGTHEGGGGTPTVNDLTGTKWFFFQTIEIGEIMAPPMAITYSLNFTDDYGGSYTQMIRWVQDTLRYDTVSVYSSSWKGNASNTYRFVTITGGASATDPDCIDWFKSNAYYCMTV